MDEVWPSFVSMAFCEGFNERGNDHADMDGAALPAGSSVGGSEMFCHGEDDSRAIERFNYNNEGVL